MQEKINIAELLKDCPTGMELDCTMIEGLEFDEIVDSYFPIRCRVKHPDGGYNAYNFTEYGCWRNEDFAKCVIYPKGKTTWDGFQRPFKDGDIVSTTNGMWLGIVKKPVGSAHETYIAIENNIVYTNVYTNNIFGFERLATEEEKAKLFQTIKDNGYKWNAETKTLEKLVEPKFKVGDKIRNKTTNRTCIITHKDNLSYYVDSSHFAIWIEEQDDYELVPNKFDINTLIPFESKVLVRDCNCHEWEGEIFTRHTNKTFNNCNFVTLGGRRWKQCIPYNDNTKHLLGTTDDCDEYYKTWKQ